MFKQIQHIDEVMPHFVGRNEFTIGHREGFVVIDYNYILPDTFDDPVRLEGRGIKFCSKTGKVLARPFHKFFNLNERDGSRFSDLPWDKPFVVQEKSDGSMIHPCILDGKLVLMTRKGMSDVAVQAMRECEFDQDEMRHFIEMGSTPIYEYVSPNNRIVIDYQKPELRLLAIRNNFTGKYGMLNTHGIRDVVVDGGDPGVLVETVRQVRGEEGVVLTWLATGHKVKLKGEEYVQLHRAIDVMASEKRILDVILEGKDDDLCSMVAEDRAAKIRDYAGTVRQIMSNIQSTVVEWADARKDLSQKEFALLVNDDNNPCRRYAPELFKYRAGKIEPADIGRSYIERQSHTQTDLESNRPMLGIPKLGTLVFNDKEA